ncbi:hypothetical protein Mkiyose1384_60960 [Mycobacterium kiyosense]|nr:hypothetical protein SRL2020400_59100 [Mycobacterium kiyosense]GLD15858.1 hypothetical protein Mkiyose1384_60960 [Mycobacterium kiyosense]GLD21964.1 hypothetical protein Mkiyose1385_60630 [Mycobacterium kiyosense]
MRYNMFARSPVVAPALPASGWCWRGYARQMPNELSELRVDVPPKPPELQRCKPQRRFS